MTKRQHPGVTQMDYALGWVVLSYRGEPVVAHAGLIDGFRVLAVLLPERKAGFAIFANRHLTRLNPALGNALIDRLCGLPAKDWNAEYAKIGGGGPGGPARRRERPSAKRCGRRATRPADGLAGEVHPPGLRECRTGAGRQTGVAVQLVPGAGGALGREHLPSERTGRSRTRSPGGEGRAKTGVVRFGGIEFRRK